MVNRWYDNNTLLIGDAAHVFPPFGGQGIAAGVKDAQALAWRLAILLRLKSDPKPQITPAIQRRIFEGWSQERRESCDEATETTKRNGRITAQRSRWKAWLHRFVMGSLWLIPFIRKWISRKAFNDRFKYTMSGDSCFVGKMSGGVKIPQVWVSNGGKPCLSDTALMKDFSRFALIVVLRKGEVIDDAQVRSTIASANIPPGLFTAENVVYLRVDGRSKNLLLDSKTTESIYWVCEEKALEQEGITPIPGYDALTIQRKVGQYAKYVVVRPDFYIHSVARNESELQSNLMELAEYFTT